MYPLPPGQLCPSCPRFCRDRFLTPLAIDTCSTIDCSTNFTLACTPAPHVLGGEFPSRDVKMLAISCDSLESHQGWLADIKAHTGHEVNFPLIADPDRRQVLYW